MWRLLAGGFRRLLTALPSVPGIPTPAVLWGGSWRAHRAGSLPPFPSAVSRGPGAYVHTEGEALGLGEPCATRPGL